MDFLSQIRGVMLGVALVLPTLWIVWEIGWKGGLESSSMREFFMKMVEPRQVAYISAWCLIVSGVLFSIQLIPN